MRWFTAHRIAKFVGQAQWSFEPGVYLGVDARGLVQVRSHARPEQALIIHDLGHVLLTPPQLISLEFANKASEQGAVTKSFLLAQRDFGCVAMEQELPGANLPEILCLRASGALPRRLISKNARHPPTLVGGLRQGEPCDLAVWDLDAPALLGLPEQEACACIWEGRAGAGVKELWIAGQRLV